MIRLALWLAGILGLTVVLHWLASRPGTVRIEWLGQILELSVFSAIVMLATLLGAVLLTWSALRQAWRSPAALARYLDLRRRRRGLDALTGGIIAVGAGDRALATRYAAQARKALPHEPLTHLLRAQAAQIGGDRATARRIFEAMLAAPDTEPLGLRGLYLEAEREGEREAARQFAERALRLNPKLGWPVDALLELQCRAADWPGALETLGLAERQHLVDRAPARRRRAVLLTAQAQALEDDAPDKALELALEAHGLARDLVPAAAVAGRILASRGRTPKAARVLLRTWRQAPHPDLAVAYAYARPGDSPRDRLDRVRHLARLTPNHPEALIAVATGAIEAHAWDEAREALKPLLEGRLTARVCALMARIEGEQYRDSGRVREWLGRAAGAGRDPAWIADGVAYPRWSPVSPATGQLDAMRWGVPAAASAHEGAAAAAAFSARLETLLGLGVAGEARVDVAAPPPGPPAGRLAPVVPEGGADGREAPAPPLPDATRGSPGASSSRPVAEPVHAPTGRDVAAAPASTLLPPPPPTPPAAAPAPAPRDSPVAADAPLSVGAKPAPVQPAARPRKPEPRIFVPPRAPDDPGADAPDLDDLQGYPTKA
jgi:HemY protein